MVGIVNSLYFCRSNNMKYWIHILCLFMPVLAISQKQVVRQQIYWISYFNTLSINEKWQVKTDIQVRRFLRPDKQHHFISRTILSRKWPGNWASGIGICYSLQSPQFPESNSDLVVPEIRPMAEVMIQPAAKSAIHWHHRYRLEARFFQHSDGTVLTDGYYFGTMRFRYNLAVEFPLIRDRHQQALLSGKLSNEIMFNAGDRIKYHVFDQNRIYLGVSYEITPTLKAELGYQWWFQQRESGVDYFSRDIYRLTIQHSVLIKK